MPSYAAYKNKMTVALDKEDEVTWITVKGNHIPIKKGQSKGDAVKEFFESKGNGGKSAPKSEAGKEAKTEKVDSGKGRGKVYTGTMKKVREFKSKDEGTFDYETGEPKTYKSGYSVSFHQNEPDDKGNWKSNYGRYSEEEYDDLVKEMQEKTGNAPNIGYFSGTPEISFWVDDPFTAVELAKKYNQKSIWDWSVEKEWRNPKYNPKKNPMKE